MLEGFTQQSVRTSGPTINTLVAGSGPPLLMLHGYPQSHIEWRFIAPRLAEHYTVVLTDLRGYGDSEDDGADLDRRVTSPTLVMWGGRSFVGKQYDVMDVWGRRVTDLRGVALPCGHFLAEELPDRTFDELTAFRADVHRCRGPLPRNLVTQCEDVIVNRRGAIDVSEKNSGIHILTADLASVPR